MHIEAFYLYWSTTPLLQNVLHPPWCVIAIAATATLDNARYSRLLWQLTDTIGYKCYVDTLFIRDIHVEGTIGIYDHEKNTRQPIVLSVEIFFVGKELPTGFVDYECLLSTIYAFLGSRAFALMEDLAQELSQNLLTLFNVRRVCVTIEKQATVKRLGVRVGVRLCRCRPRSTQSTP